jgi:hypothetical protein
MPPPGALYRAGYGCEQLRQVSMSNVATGWTADRRSLQAALIRRWRPLSPIGIKEPGMIGVMEPVSGEENGHPFRG